MGALPSTALKPSTGCWTSVKAAPCSTAGGGKRAEHAARQIDDLRDR